MPRIALSLSEAEEFVDRFLTEAFEERKHGKALADALVDIALGEGPYVLNQLLEARAEAYREADARERGETHGRCSCVNCCESKRGA
jgi:hypothetical protein